MKTHNYVYSIENRINGKIYIGCHQTNNLDDNYMGSGTILLKAYKKYGTDNFTKTILRNFDNPFEMFEYEKYLVDENFVRRSDTYNLTEGGNGGAVKVAYKDDEDNVYFLYNDDPVINSKSLVPINTGYKVVFSKDNDSVRIPIDKNLDGYSGFTSGKVLVKNKEGKSFWVNNSDTELQSGSLLPFNKGLITVKNLNGEFTQISLEEFEKSRNDYMGTFTNCKHSDTAKRKIGEKNAIHQQGTGNSQYGTCWVNKGIGKNKKIKKELLDRYIENGWIKGRRISK